MFLSCTSCCPPPLKVAAKIATLIAVKALKKGNILAHDTATLSGVTSSLDAIAQLQCFKQRKGPFLLLAASVADALKLSRVRSHALRKIANRYWPGAVTLVFSARQGLPAACYHQGSIAVRVDASPEVRYLAKKMGGLIVSSSLNRRKQPTLPANRRTHLKLSCWIHGRIKSYRPPNGQASTIFLIKGTRVVTLR